MKYSIQINSNQSPENQNKEEACSLHLVLLEDQDVPMENWQTSSDIQRIKLIYLWEIFNKLMIQIGFKA